MPVVISLRVLDHELEPLLEKWRRLNPGLPWSWMLNQALRGRSPLVPLAGKRHAHLVGRRAA